MQRQANNISIFTALENSIINKNTSEFNGLLSLCQQLQPYGLGQYRNAKNQTFLHIAILAQWDVAFNALLPLLKDDETVFVRDEQGGTVFWWAIVALNVEATEKLIPCFKGLDWKEERIPQILHALVVEGRYIQTIRMRFLDLLLDQEECKGLMDHELVKRACTYGSIETIKLFIKHDVDKLLLIEHAIELQSNNEKLLEYIWQNINDNQKNYFLSVYNKKIHQLKQKDEWLENDPRMVFYYQWNGRISLRKLAQAHLEFDASVPPATSNKPEAQIKSDILLDKDLIPVTYAKKVLEAEQALNIKRASQEEGMKMLLEEINTPERCMEVQQKLINLIEADIDSRKSKLFKAKFSTISLIILGAVIVVLSLTALMLLPYLGAMLASTMAGFAIAGGCLLGFSLGVGLWMYSHYVSDLYLNELIKKEDIDNINQQKQKMIEISLTLDDDYLAVNKNIVKELSSEDNLNEIAEAAPSLVDEPLNKIKNKVLTMKENIQKVSLLRKHSFINNEESVAGEKSVPLVNSNDRAFSAH